MAYSTSLFCTWYHKHAVDESEINLDAMELRITCCCVQTELDSTVNVNTNLNENQQGGSWSSIQSVLRKFSVTACLKLKGNVPAFTVNAAHVGSI